jgi:hypothetical protein
MHDYALKWTTPGIQVALRTTILEKHSECGFYATSQSKKLYFYPDQGSVSGPGCRRVIGSSGTLSGKKLERDMQNVTTIRSNTTMANSNALDEIKRKYHQLRKVKLGDAAKTSLAHFFREINHRNDFHRSALDARDAYILSVRLAHALTEDEFIDVLVKGQVPPIKLSKVDMQFLRGGVVKDSLAVLPMPPEYFLEPAAIV